MADQYVNVREIFGGVIGQRVIEITQHDEEEFRTEGACYICLHFENGTTAKFPIGEAGFDLQEPD
jgi:hypothetical protein